MLIAEIILIALVIILILMGYKQTELKKKYFLWMLAYTQFIVYGVVFSSMLTVLFGVAFLLWEGYNFWKCFD